MLKRIIASCVLAVAALVALMPLAAHADFTPAQQATVCTAVKADAVANAARIAGDTFALQQWMNGARVPTVLAWRADVPAQESDEAATYTSYDSIVSGKRDSWVLFLAYPRDFGRNKVRNVVTDIWGNATAGSVAEAVLLSATRPATNTQVALGGTVKTTGTVTATDYSVDQVATQGDATYMVNPPCTVQ